MHGTGVAIPSMEYSDKSPTFAGNKSYVVYLGAHSHGPLATSADYEKVKTTHYGFLASCLGSEEKAKGAILYSYTRHINGFSAILDEEEAIELAKNPEVKSIFLNKGRKLHTTRSWEFLGLERDGRTLAGSLWQKAKFGKDVIIGNLDTGVWPESESFRDEGMGPVPSKWKGICQNDTKGGVSCNRKLIGARYFSKGYESYAGPLDPSLATPRDTAGHGSHTLSTAGGRMVPASIFGYANGTAKGGSPNARVAAYKVCWAPINGSECFDADILAAFDMAIHDGVDVLSVSLGGPPSDYLNDGIAIGSFHAVSNGITVICSAGNDGPYAGSVSNVAPWILTVGASTIDRNFESDALLGNKKLYKGQSLSDKFLPEKLYPLINAADAKSANASITTLDAQQCHIGSLDPVKVKGKIVFCLRGVNARVEKGEAVREAGGIGMILGNDPTTGNDLTADAHVLPAAHITASAGAAVLSYISSTKTPTAYISRPKTILNTKPAPFMAAFSSQGPNTVTPEILKPDITAPGVSILAAYSEATSPTDLPFDTRRVPFYIVSGTSMSCPHISGIVGLLKALHPDWSPAAIRSAIMTSSRTRDNKMEPMMNSSFTKATPFSYGAGHVRPNRAMDPGLVYDLTSEDYLNFLCSLGYNASTMSIFYEKPYSCPSKKLSLLQLNYPSITVPSLAGPTTVTRTVRNVGGPGTYKARFHAPQGVLMSVKPDSLVFKKNGEEKKFQVTLAPKGGIGIGSDYVFGRLIWSDGMHYVRSPVVVKGGL
ncbi:hypothetical protein MRB53_023011 [Persea americana]|uniref:Uncharacterized protein n=1 Tax=Persea americana TaxID=3435 RepID=A0ACC2L980_PERAE|nr:hypothetical protein MRB53_023011 [Persea americana]